MPTNASRSGTLSATERLLPRSHPFLSIEEDRSEGDGRDDDDDSDDEIPEWWNDATFEDVKKRVLFQLNATWKQMAREGLNPQKLPATGNLLSLFPE
jgi:hypothetical protein